MGCKTDKFMLQSTLEKILTAKEYEDKETNPKYIIIKVKDYWLSEVIILQISERALCFAFSPHF